MCWQSGNSCWGNKQQGRRGAPSHCSGQQWTNILHIKLNSGELDPVSRIQALESYGALLNISRGYGYLSPIILTRDDGGEYSVKK